MAYLVRAFRSVAWTNCTSYKFLPADTITQGELRTTKNVLSLWKINSLDEMESVAIAFGVSGTYKSESTIELIAIPIEKIEEISVLKQINSTTPFVEFRDRHYDICNLNYEKLGLFAKLILEQIKDDANYFCISYPKLKKKVKTLITEKRISKKSLDKNFEN